MREEFTEVLAVVRDRRSRLLKYRLEINDVDLNDIVREETPIEHSKAIQMYLVVENRKTLFCASRNENKLYYFKQIIDDYYDESF